MNDRVARTDIEVQFFQSEAAVVFEVLLYFDFNIVPREVMAQLLPIGAKFVGYGRNEYSHRVLIDASDVCSIFLNHFRCSSLDCSLGWQVKAGSADQTFVLRCV